MKSIKKLKEEATPEKELKGIVFDRCMRLISQLRNKNHRRHVAQALAALYGPRRIV